MTSTEYYRKSRKGRAKKAKDDAEINRRPEQVQKRVESNRKRRRAKSRGQDVRGKDYDHATNRFVDSSTNRGRAGEGGRKRGRRSL